MHLQTLPDGLSFSRIFLQPKIPNLARSTVRRTK